MVSGPLPGGPSGVVGVVLASATGKPGEATITVRADDSHELWDAAWGKGSKRRADGRRYLLPPGPAQGRWASTSWAGRTSAHRVEKAAAGCPRLQGCWW